jgi:hypothetical protein
MSATAFTPQFPNIKPVDAVNTKQADMRALIAFSIPRIKLLDLSNPP